MAPCCYHNHILYTNTQIIYTLYYINIDKYILPTLPVPIIATFINKITPSFFLMYYAEFSVAVDSNKFLKNLFMVNYLLHYLHLRVNRLKILN